MANIIKTLESAIMNDILTHLQRSCVLVWRNNTGRRSGVRYGLGVGSADLIGVVRGRMLAIEVKRPGGKPSADQITWMRVVNMHGGYAVVVTSVPEAIAAVRAAEAGEEAPRVRHI
jgi:hypothetical protein